MGREAQSEAIREATAAMADRMAAEKSFLTDLDSAIGDADHGANMNRGFQAALARLEDADDDPATLVKTVGVALVSEVGGAAGPLYGGSLMKASGELEEGVTAESSVAFAERYLETVEERGKASVGDKTMVDAITPAVHTYRKAIEVDDHDPLEALGKAVDAAERGVAFTTPIRAKKGRASYLGWRSVGHQDPGATSTLYLLEELFAVAEEHLDGDVEIDAEADVDPEELGEPAVGGDVDESANSDGGS
ncbi:dihydroxyacetone kinase subunit DhaL [Natronococcus sp. A-GB1]|uniref:dihydroxyacetone kinase subunit DhaL n=1 Tax=Natronococcus sp. A-GB1 TaxID=3037648 RepID=UPI00241F6321|nr:dihydroxyacetone kinase subunit DhaL [Natronococcus sp. A-GB1]MDG5760963.1 dihydroxyacetone kinase subunit DhaL [Natronococcus sp. A-GB1]